MADVNATAPQPILLGNKIVTPGADGKTVKVSEKDGSNAQSMDVEEFKKYITAHKDEILASIKQQGDTTHFSGKATSFGSNPGNAGGLTTGETILGGAGATGVGVWQKDNIVKYWGKAADYCKKLKV